MNYETQVKINKAMECVLYSFIEQLNPNDPHSLCDLVCGQKKQVIEALKIKGLEGTYSQLKKFLTEAKKASQKVQSEIELSNQSMNTLNDYLNEMPKTQLGKTNINTGLDDMCEDILNDFKKQYNMD